MRLGNSGLVGSTGLVLTAWWKDPVFDSPSGHKVFEQETKPSLRHYTQMITWRRSAREMRQCAVGGLSANEAGDVTAQGR